MKLTVDIPAAVIHQAQVVAAKRRQPLKKMIADLLQQALAKNGRNTSKSAQPKLRRVRAIPPSAADRWLEEWRAISLVVSARTKGRVSAAETLSRMRR